MAWDGLASTQTNYVWGAQFETGAVARSYIPTVGATVTRAADLSTGAATTRTLDYGYTKNLEFFNPTEGTLFAESSVYSMLPTYGGLVSLNSSSAASDIQLFRQGNTYRTEVFTANGINADIQVFPGTANTTSASVAYKQNDVAISVEGGIVNDTSVNIPTGINYFEIGAFNYQFAPMNGHIKKIAYYTKRLSDATLQALTK